LCPRRVHSTSADADSHDAIVSGHLGVAKTLDRLSRNFTWPSMYAQVTAYVSTCDCCQRDKSSNQRPTGLLQPLEVPDEPWSHVSLDFFMDLPPSGGFDAILVVLHKLSKSLVLVPTNTTVTAKETARLYFNNVYCRHGLARNIISDRDVRFTGTLMQELHRLLQVKLAKSSSFRPETDGQTERANKTMEEMIRHYVSHRQDDWHHLLPALEFAYNSSKHRATGTSPFYTSAGRHPLKFDEMLLGPPSSKSLSVVHEVLSMKARSRSANASIQLYKNIMASYANKRRRPEEHQVGDLVMLTTKFFKPPSDSSRARKLAPKFAGPYKVIKRVSPVAYKLELPQGTNAQPVFHSSLLKVYKIDSTIERVNQVPEPISVDGQVEYIVDSVLDERVRRGKKRIFGTLGGLSHQ
jgi:Integrase zinc binding domain